MPSVEAAAGILAFFTGGVGSDRTGRGVAVTGGRLSGADRLVAVTGGMLSVADCTVAATDGALSGTARALAVTGGMLSGADTTADAGGICRVCAGVAGAVSSNDSTTGELPSSAGSTRNG